MAYIGIDLGGTKTEGIVMNPQGDALSRLRVDTPADGPPSRRYEAIIASIVALVRDLEATAGSPCSVGIGTPGSISDRTGLLKNANTTCLNGRDIKKDIEIALSRPVRIENDANCFTLSEAVDGAAARHSMVFGVIMGTGVGGGLVLDGRLLPGRHHIAGEWGHNTLEADGPPCYCGRRGCVEVFLSGPGLLRDWPDEPTRPSSVQALLDRYRARDETAGQVMGRFFQRFGKALAMVVNIVDPDAIVLGGGLSNMEELYSRGIEALRGHVFNDVLTTPVLLNRHGDSSGVRGAARLWATESSTRSF